MRNDLRLRYSIDDGHSDLVASRPLKNKEVPLSSGKLNIGKRVGGVKVIGLEQYGSRSAVLVGAELRAPIITERTKGKKFSIIDRRGSIRESDPRTEHPCLVSCGLAAFVRNACERPC